MQDLVTRRMLCLAVQVAMRVPEQVWQMPLAPGQMLQVRLPASARVAVRLPEMPRVRARLTRLIAD